MTTTTETLTVYVIESCDEEEGQVFWDVIPARDPEHAVEEWETVRGSYATISAHKELAEFVEWISDAIDGLSKHTAHSALASWSKFQAENRTDM